MAPRLVPRLLALVQDPDANPEDIIELIRMDAAISTMIIAVCRSAAIQRGEEVSSVDDAIRCLGFLGVYRIVLLLAFKRGYSDSFYLYRDTPNRLWRRTILTGYFMEEFADEIGANRATYYSCGLLHAIGMFYIDWHGESRKLPPIQIEDRRQMLSAERALVGHCHTELSAMILEFWGFPDTITKTVGQCDAAASQIGIAPGARHLALAIRLACAPQSLVASLIKGTTSEDLISPTGLPLGPIVERVVRHLECSERFLAL
jgi:HD-like signal output (HDOD) protein